MFIYHVILYSIMLHHILLRYVILYDVRYYIIDPLNTYILYFSISHEMIMVAPETDEIRVDGV